MTSSIPRAVKLAPPPTFDVNVPADPAMRAAFLRTLEIDVLVYEGTALTDRGWDYAGVLPDRITIYRLPTLQVCDTETDVVDEVAITVVHEIAHHFGIDDQRLHELGWG